MLLSGNKLWTIQSSGLNLGTLSFVCDKPADSFQILLIKSKFVAKTNCEYMLFTVQTKCQDHLKVNVTVSKITGKMLLRKHCVEI